MQRLPAGGRQPLLIFSINRMGDGVMNRVGTLLRCWYQRVLAGIGGVTGSTPERGIVDALHAKRRFVFRVARFAASRQAKWHADWRSADVVTLKRREQPESRQNSRSAQSKNRGAAKQKAVNGLR